MAVALLLLPRFKGTISNSVRLLSSSTALIQSQWTHFADDSDASDGESPVYRKALKLQRPTTIRCEESLLNVVSLIGRICHPFKECNSERFGVHTTLRVSAFSGHFSVLLKFWDDIAEMTVQHLKVYDLVYVSGRLGSYIKADENRKSMHHYEVVVREVNFVSEDGLGPAYKNFFKPGPVVSYKQKRRERLHLWQIFFASPSEWWDNRNHKSNPNSPDFKHKDTGEVLWLTHNDPLWVRKQLQLHDSISYRQTAPPHLSPLLYE